MSTGGTREGNILLVPSEGVVRGRLRKNVGNHRDVVGVVAANDRIGLDGKRRVRVDRNRVGEGHDGLTTSSRLLDGNFIDVNRRIVADSMRGLGENSADSVRNDFAVSVPCEDLTTRNTTVNGSCEGHRTTVAQSIGCGQIVGERNGRISIDGHINRVARSLAERVELLSSEGVSMSAFRRNNRVCQGGGTGNQVAVVIPLVLHVRSVPVVQVGSQRDFTTDANRVFGSDNVHDGNGVNIDYGLSRSLATVFVHQGDAEVVRIISVILGQRDCVEMSTGSTRDHSIVLKPSEGVVRGRLRIDMSNHRDVVSSIATNDRICFDSKRRIRVNNNRVGKGHDGLTTVGRLLDGHFIDIDSRIVADSVRGLCEDSADSVRNDFAVSVPCEDLTTGNTTFNSSREGHRTTVAQSSGSRQIAGDINGRIRIDNNQNGVDVMTLGSGLDNFNTNLRGVCINSSISTGVSTRNIVTIRSVSIEIGRLATRITNDKGVDTVSDFIPLINNVLSVRINQVGSQSDFTALTNLSLSSRDIHIRNRKDIDEIFSRTCCATGRNTFSLNFNNESVRLIARIPVFSIELVITKRVSHVVSKHSAFIPCVVQQTDISTNGIGIGLQEDRVGSANKLVTRDHNGRVRIDGESSGGGRCGNATGHRCGNSDRINILLRVVVNSNRRIIDGLCNSTRHQDSISVPCINIVVRSRSVSIEISCNHDLSALANNGVRQGDRSDNRIRMNSNCEELAGSSTMRIQLQCRELVVVSSEFSRRHRVGQVSSTIDRIVTLVPLILHVRGVPVVEVSRQSNCTTNANIGVSSSDVDDRNRVNINLSFSNSLATIIVHQRDAEVIRIVSVSLRKDQSVEMHSSSTREGNIVLKPVECVRSGGSRRNMSKQLDIVSTITANNRIGFDGNRRIRVNDNSVNEGQDRNTTGVALRNRNFVCVSGRITIDSLREVNQCVTRDILNQFTISEPGENLSASNTTLDGSNNLDGLAFANLMVSRNVGGNNHNRIIDHTNGNRVAVTTVVHIVLAGLQQVRDFNNVVSGRVHLEGLIRKSTTRQQIDRGNMVSIPLVGKHRIIVIVDTSLQLDFTTVTNHSVGSQNVHNRSIVNFNHKRITERRATITIGHLDQIGVRIQVSRLNVLSQQVTIDGRADDLLTVTIERVGSIGINCTVNVCEESQVDVFHTSETDVMHTIQHNHRVTSHMNSVGRDRNCGATGNIGVNVCGVDIVNGIVIQSPNLLGETISMSVRHNVAVLSPNVGQVRIDSVILVKISGNRDLGTLANLVSFVHAIDSNHGVDGGRIEGVGNSATCSRATRGGLGYLNSNHSVVSRDRSCENTLGTISNSNIVDIPLIG